MNIFCEQDKNQKINIAEKILYSLPEWFGIPESTNEYIEKASDMPFFTVYEKESAIGFLAIKQTSQYAAEIYVMGVLLQYHHLGAGRMLFEAAHRFCKENKYEYLQVKTLDESFDDAAYSKTRAFYKAMGFKKLECIKEIWGESCPCAIMIMKI